MAIPQGQLSSIVVEGAYLSPEGGAYQKLSDIERGPVAVEDTSGGLIYQDWVMTWDGGTGDFTLTPQTSGTPSVPYNTANVSRFTFTFDQNARVYIAWEDTGGTSWFWWYDTLAGMKVTTNLNTLYGGAVYGPRCHMDDRRSTQYANNDILLFYTMDSATSGYELFMGIQRERFQTKNSLIDEIPYKNVQKCGMHNGLRLKLVMGAQ